MAYTRAQVRDLIRQRCAIENTTAQVDAELNNHINDATSYSHDFLIATLGEGYSNSSIQIVTIAGVNSYSVIASDFYRPIGVRLLYDDLSVPLSRMNLSDRVVQTTAESWGPGSLPHYAVIMQNDGTFSVSFDPPPDTQHVTQLDYHPVAPTYSSDSAVVALPHPDLLITEACIRVKVKEERDASFFLSEREAIQRRIESWVGTIDMGEPERTRVPRRGWRSRRDRLF